MEYVQLKSTLEATQNAEYRCAACQTKYEKKPKQFEFKGCEKPQTTAQPIFRIGHDLKFWTCPGNFYSFGAAHWIENYHMYEKGVLPFPGSLCDQPAKAIEALSLVGNYLAEKRDEARKAEQRKLNRAGRV